LLREQQQRQATGLPKGGATALETELDEERGPGKGKAGKGGRPGTVGDRDRRRKERAKRAEERKVQGGVVVEAGHAILLEEDRPRTGLKPRLRPGARPSVVAPRPKGGKVAIEPPLTVRALCEALGLPFQGDLLFKLRSHGVQSPASTPPWNPT